LCRLIFIPGGLLIVMGNDGTTRLFRSPVLLLQAGRIRPQTTCCDSSASTSASPSSVSSSRTATAKPDVLRLIANYCFPFCWIGCLYGITSERKLVEELGMHLAWRWFTELGFITRFRITLPCPRNVTGVCRNRTCSAIPGGLSGCFPVRDGGCRPLDAGMQSYFARLERWGSTKL